MPKMIRFGVLLSCVLLGSLAHAAGGGKKGLKVNSELFDIGIIAGSINIEDFPSQFEPLLGVNITFKASEYFFLQYNFIQTEIGVSSVEANDAIAGFGLEDRDFTHYDLLVGYNIFQGEFFSSDGQANLSNLYVVGGFGDTEMGGESNFTYTIGAGYLIEFARKYLVRIDYRDYIFDSSLLVSEGEETIHNTQFSIGIGYLF
ncbi:hypothetical protein TDB9533_04202 [Thalassocella blandensis]|nr:hypothetical protein TDB9533_04202 [Thalassocella blandensis]